MIRSARLTLWLLAALIAALPALAGTPALVQSANQQDCTATTHTSFAATFGNTVGSGHTVAGYTIWAPGTPGNPTVTDDKGNTYTVQNVTYDGHTESHAFYAINITNSPKTITATYPGAEGFVSISISEFSNIASFDVGTAATQVSPGTGANAITSGSKTTTANGELVYGAVSAYFGQITLSHGSGFTDADNPSASSSCSYATEYQVQSAAGSIAATATAGTSPSGSEAQMLAFKATVTPPPGNPGSSPGTSNMMLSGAGSGLFSSATGTPVTPPADNRVPCNYYVRPSGGNDSNAGTTPATAFNTLAKLQTTLQGAAAGNKVGCLLQGSGGTYSPGAGLTFSSADTGEYWETDPASPLNSAVIDGGGTLATFVSAGTAQNVTFNGIKVQHFTTYIFNGNNNSTGWTIENSDLGNGGSVGAGCGVGCSLVVSLGKNTTIKNNYCHDWFSACLTAFAFNSGDSVDGTLIDRNVVINTCTGLDDCGAIYLNMRNTAGAGGKVTVTNNYVIKYGFAEGSGNGFHAFYEDDDASNAVVTGNIFGPPVAGTPPNETMTTWNGGFGNNISLNIIDQGANNFIPINASGPCGTGGTIDGPTVCTGPTTANVLNKNLNLMKFAGASNYNAFGQGNNTYSQNSGETSSWISIPTNWYWNLGGGATNSSGNNVSDAAPITNVNPGCTTDLYVLSNVPVGFTDVTAARNAGPPGFTIPSTSLSSCH